MLLHRRALTIVASLVLVATAFAQVPSGPWPPLVPCGPADADPCVEVVTAADRMAGVWRQVLVNPILRPPDAMAFVRYTEDGAFWVADTVEATVGPYGGYPHGRVVFDGDVMTFHVEGDGVPPECRTATYRIQVLVHRGERVAMIFQPISDECAGRRASVTVPLIRIAGD